MDKHYYLVDYYRDENNQLAFLIHKMSNNVNKEDFVRKYTPVGKLLISKKKVKFVEIENMLRDLFAKKGLVFKISKVK